FGEKIAPRFFRVLKPRKFAGVGSAPQIENFKREARGEIPFEEAGVNDNATNDAGQSKTDDAPVITWRSAAAGLPAIHPFPARGEFPLDEDRLRWLEQVRFGSEEFVVRFQDAPAEALESQVHQLGG